MTTIPKTYFYNFQRHHLKAHILDKVDRQLKLLHEDAKGQELVLEFDARHASARRSLHTTATWINMNTGKVMLTRSEEHENNSESAKSESRCFKNGMGYLLNVCKLEIAEIVHDDCKELSKWLLDTVSCF